MAKEKQIKPVMSPVYKGLDSADPETKLTQEQVEQGIEQFKGDVKSYLDSEEERIVSDIKIQKPVPSLTRTEEIAETPEGEIPSRTRPGAYTPSTPQVEIPTTLPEHGIKALYSTEERILERATQITGLPPESPANHQIAQVLAKGDPFSASSMEKAKEETMKLVRAGLIPNPNYDGFDAEVAEFVDWANPMAVEIIGTLGTGIVTSPLLLAPEPLTKATWYGLNASSSAFWNMVAQQMEIGSGIREETNWSEVLASGALGAVPGIKTGVGLSRAGVIGVRAAEGAGLGIGYEGLRLGFAAIYGEDLDFSIAGLAAAPILGATIGGTLGRLESALVIYKANSSAQGASVLRKVITDELKQVKKELQRTEKNGGVNKTARTKVEKLESQLQELIPNEEKVLQQSIDALEQAEVKQMEEVAKVAEEFKKTEAFKLFTEVEVQGERGAVSSGVPGVLPKQLSGAKPRYNYGERSIELNFENDIAKALYIAGSGQSSKRKQEYINWLKSQGVEDVDGLAKQVRDGIKSQAKAGQDSVFIKSPLKFVEPPTPKSTEASTVKIDREDVPPLSQEDFDELKEVTEQAREILDDFLSGGGTRQVDPITGKVLDSHDEVKARLLTDDSEKQRLINSVTSAISDDLKNVKGGRVGKLEYLAKVQNELDRRLGAKASEELAIVMNAAQVADNAEVADTISKLGVYMAANGAVMVKGYDDLIKLLTDADLNDPNIINNATSSILKLIPQQLAWKKAGAESGRLLQTRKYTKDILDVKQKEVLEGLEGNLVKDLKEAKELTDEQLQEQIKTFGDIQVVKKLLKTIQQADDTSEVHKILVEQQKVFQNTWKNTAKKYLSRPYEPDETGNASTYTKVRDMGWDVAYAVMLCSPVTHAKVLISNTIMSKYNALNGWVGARFMSKLPWTTEGITKEEWKRAGDFWSKTATTFSAYGGIVHKEAMKTLKSGDSDLRSHFERVGKSAWSMERTGMSGALGATLENIGSHIDLPGKALAFLDVRTRLNVAHAMTHAKAEVDYQKAVASGESVGTFRQYYDNFVSKVFTESKGKLMTEDQVRRKAVLMAEKEGVAPENLASYMDNFVKNNWDKDTSAFVDYVQRNLKEVTFTEEMGEFADPNLLEKGNYYLEQFLRTYPTLQAILNPFMRTGRNIHRGAAAVTSPLKTLTAAIDKIPVANRAPFMKDVPRLAEKLWAKTTKDLASDDPIISARARGQQITSIGILATAMGLAEGIPGVAEFVGTESQDWKMKKAIRTATGMPEYTLRIADITRPGKTKAISLAALEPFNTIMSVTADMKSLSNGTVAQREEARNLYEAFTLALSNNIFNKSYYKNLGDAMKLVTSATSDKEAQAAQAFRLLKGMVGNVIPSVQNTVNYMSDDVIRENNSIMQVIARRMNGLSKAVPPMRDIFGDIELRGFSDKRGGGVNVWSPFGVYNQTGDIDQYVEIDEVTGFRTLKVPKITKSTVAVELRKKGKKDATENDIELAYQAKIREAAYATIIELGIAPHFNAGTTKWNGIDLQEIIHPDTQQDAFDRWQELTNEMKLNSMSLPSKSGKTLKETIVALASGKSVPAYGVFDKRVRRAPKTALPEGTAQEDTERISTIKAVFREFRNEALEKLKKEFPILEEQKEAVEVFEEKLDRPLRSPQDLEARRKFELEVSEQKFPEEKYKEQQVPSKLEELMLPFRRN